MSSANRQISRANSQQSPAGQSARSVAGEEELREHPVSFRGEPQPGCPRVVRVPGAADHAQPLKLLGFRVTAGASVPRSS
jgi:hypothetical protein